MAQGNITGYIEGQWVRATFAGNVRSVTFNKRKTVARAETGRVRQKRIECDSNNNNNKKIIVCARGEAGFGGVKETEQMRAEATCGRPFL